jgi:hypothetical protein
MQSSIRSEKQMLKPPFESKGSTNQRCLIKTFVHVILITILSAGIAQASGDPLLEDCELCEIADSDHRQPHQEHDMHHEGSSCPKTCPRCHVLKFLTEIDESDILSQSKEESPTTINFTPSATSVFSLGQFNKCFAYLVKLQNKVPDVPLFYRNASLLF